MTNLLQFTMNVQPQRSSQHIFTFCVSNSIQTDSQQLVLCIRRTLGKFLT